MKVLVTYLSRSGNTRKVAEAIYESLDGDKEIKAMKDVSNTDSYDMLFIGFPVIGAGAPGAAKRFMARLPAGKKVALFLTHGMPGGMAKLGPMVEKCRKAAEGKELVGIYDCQGRLAGYMSIILRLYPDREVREWAASGGDGIGIGHPNMDELSKAAAFGRAVAG